MEDGWLAIEIYLKMKLDDDVVKLYWRLNSQTMYLSLRRCRLSVIFNFLDTTQRQFIYTSSIFPLRAKKQKTSRNNVDLFSFKKMKRGRVFRNTANETRGLGVSSSPYNIDQC